MDSILLLLLAFLTYFILMYPGFDWIVVCMGKIETRYTNIMSLIYNLFYANDIHVMGNIISVKDK